MVYFLETFRYNSYANFFVGSDEGLMMGEYRRNKKYKEENAI